MKDPALLSMKYIERRLDMDRETLRAIASKRETLYRPFHRQVIGTTKVRHIDNPAESLKRIQRRIARLIFQHAPPPPSMFGAIPGRSANDNAREHEGARTAVRIDLADCFPNINDRMVFQGMVDVLGCSTRTAGLLTQLVTVAYHLPQGAPSSPMVANMILTPLAKKLHDLSKRMGIKATMYVDDIILSGTRAEEAIEPIIALIHTAGHRVRTKKIQVMRSRRESIRITGAVVNRELSGGNQRLHQIRNDILDAGTLGVSVPQWKLDSIAGKIQWVSQVSARQGKTLRRFAESHLPLMGQDFGEAPDRELRSDCTCDLGRFARRQVP